MLYEPDADPPPEAPDADPELEPEAPADAGDYPPASSDVLGDHLPIRGPAE